MIKRQPTTNRSTTNKTIMISYRYPVDMQAALDNAIACSGLTRTEFMINATNEAITGCRAIIEPVKGVTYQCASCALVLPLICYMSDKSKSSGHKSYCKNCTAIQNKKRADTK